ncbi:hypothetical protein ITI46_06150 [Streptomyces oryzae]|uniref:Uncharacterized protein n=1 Tax=Streptomyces oryzae TaxID=1434886 RepID=A0ABS3X7H5_9ACTN|nr:hypothetical protein [Streptomyces oryzae]MBO8191274.1 hypothetical protein [Streptomyces oryzae]
MNTIWQLLVERHESAPGGGFWTTEVIGECTGTREQAMTLLEQRARAYAPEHPWNPQRVQFYRVADGFMTVIEGLRHRRRWTCRFVLAELLYDGPPPVPLAPQPPAAPPRPAAPPGGW